MNALIVSIGGQRWGAGLDRATRLLAGQTGTVTLVHIIPRTTFFGRGLPVWDELYDTRTESAASVALLQEGARHLARCCPGLTIGTKSIVGEPQDLILRTAAETRADVVILDGRLLNSCPFATAPARETAAPATALGASIVAEDRRVAV